MCLYGLPQMTSNADALILKLQFGGIDNHFKIQTHMEMLFLYSPLPLPEQRIITELCQVIKMLNILTNIPNSATQ